MICCQTIRTEEKFIWVLLVSSAKSWFITQKLLIKALKDKRRVLVCRRYGSTLRQTVYETFKQVISSFKITQYCKFNESMLKITLPNGSEFIFIGLDEETKLLSLANISDIFVEEIWEVSRDLWEQLDLRMRGKAECPQLFAAFNPIQKSSWLFEYCEKNPPDSFLYVHSTFRDNPFLSDDYIKSLEDLYKTNPAKARIFCDGEWGINPEGLVIQNWRKQDFDPMHLASLGYEHRVGMDLGWVDKSAIIDSLYDRQNKTIYVFDEFYKSGCQLSELADQIKKMGLQKCKIYVDAAEPRSIQFFRQEGINATACYKGRDSVKAGLMFLQDNLIIVHPKCKNFIMELENFSYVKSKLTGEWTEDTTHEWSHAIDACRYAYSDIYANPKLKTMSKEALGL